MPSATTVLADSFNQPDVTLLRGGGQPTGEFLASFGDLLSQFLCAVDHDTCSSGVEHVGYFSLERAPTGLRIKHPEAAIPLNEMVASLRADFSSEDAAAPLLQTLLAERKPGWVKTIAFTPGEGYEVFLLAVVGFSEGGEA